MSSVPSSRSLLASLAVLLATTGSPTLAATFHVTKTADTNDGACAPTDCSLREAVIAANALVGPDTILLPAGTYELTIVGPDEDAAATGDLDSVESYSDQGIRFRASFEAPVLAR